ncbi:kinase-like domain-containing protein [Mariannaea sp. PMI_226]|nr:kinase-like domain-containing protein [Mariannaea sp. PMI_226]
MDAQSPTHRKLDAAFNSRGVFERLKQVRKQRGQARSSDEDELDELDEDTLLLHKLFGREVTLSPDKIVTKSGKRINLQEVNALQVARKAQLPVPCVYNTETTQDGTKHLKMEYIEGETLNKIWPNMSTNEKKDIAQQLRTLLEIMQSIPPPPNLIGGCDGEEIRDLHVRSIHRAPSCINEEGFNAYILSSLSQSIPSSIYKAFAQRLQTNHRIVFSHCDLSPRNIIVKEGKIKGLIDWELAGWYPEYWEYVKFFERSDRKEGDWLDYADHIFPQKYPNELVDYLAMSKWQLP